MRESRLPDHVREWLRVAATSTDRAVRREAWARYRQWLQHQRGVLL
jgi:hypothetical protein